MKCPSGWQQVLYQDRGALANALCHIVTRNYYKGRRGERIPRTLMYIGGNKPARWFENPHKKLSYAAKKRNAFLQLSLAVTLRFLEKHGFATDNLNLYLHACKGVHALGFSWRQVVLMLVCNYPNQGIRAFKSKLDVWDRELKAAGFWPRWVFPHTALFLNDSPCLWPRMEPGYLYQDRGGGEHVWPLISPFQPEDLDPGINFFRLNIGVLHDAVFPKEAR